MLQFTIQHYGNALQYGNRFIYHCMPRALSLWLDYGSGLHDPSKLSLNSLPIVLIRSIADLVLVFSI